MSNTLQTLIRKTTGPCVVLAGAGTGKTHTIVEKLQYLIESGVPAEKVVCITFSNEATASIASRVEQKIPDARPIISTFHAFAATLLKEHDTAQFQLLTPDDAKILLHRTLRVPPGLCHTYVHSLHMARDQGITLAMLKAHFTNQAKGRTNEDIEKEYQALQFSLQTSYVAADRKTKSALVVQLKELKQLLDRKKFMSTWEGYEKIKEKHKYYDYGDLQDKALALLLKRPELTENYAYVIVDEFQDTNKIQLDFIKALCPNHNITIVGDPNQSIYRFRGAYTDNFAQFKHDHKVTASDCFTLAASYRSPNTVLRVAHQISGTEGVEVTNAHQREGEPIEVYELLSGKEEARKIRELVEQCVREGKRYEDICVIIRTHQQGILIRRALEGAGIPYTAAAKQTLLKQPLIKTLHLYLTLAHDLQTQARGNEHAWWECFFREQFSPEELVILGRKIKELREESSFSTTLYASLSTLPLSEEGKKKLSAIQQRIALLTPLPGTASAAIEQALVALAPVFALNKETIPYIERFKELALQHAALYTPDVGSFLYYLDIIVALEVDITLETLVAPGVRIMTAHATKGLEFPVVILSNCAEKRFPLERFSTNALIPAELMSGERRDGFLHEEYEREQQLREEKRLAYVACTRAKERLVMTYAQTYANKGGGPSSILTSISYLTNKDIQYTKDTHESPVIELSVSLPAQKSVGKRVYSPSQLLLFTECQKAYEYKYVYHMPERKTVAWEAMKLGSFVHAVAEEWITLHLQTYAELEQKARELHLQEEWHAVDMNDALRLLRVLYERHKNVVTAHSLTEQELKVTLGPHQFIGFADRIDRTPDGLTIVDYKTGKTPISPLHRTWQLGYYALAAAQLGRVRTVILDMLQHDKPLVFRIDDNGTAHGIHSDRMDFTIHEVQAQLIATADAIERALQHGFQACAPDKQCAFCLEYAYKL